MNQDQVVVRSVYRFQVPCKYLTKLSVVLGIFKHFLAICRLCLPSQRLEMTDELSLRCSKYYPGVLLGQNAGGDIFGLPSLDENADTGVEMSHCHQAGCVAQNFQTRICTRTEIAGTIQ